VTLSDDEAKRRGTQKSVLERKAYPAFQIAIEINKQNSWTIHEDIKSSIDLLLRDRFAITQIRKLSRHQKTIIKYKKLQTDSFSLIKNFSHRNPQSINFQDNWFSPNSHRTLQNFKSKKSFIFIYSLSPNLIYEILTKLQFQFVVTKEIKKTSLIIGPAHHLKENSKLRNLAKKYNIPICSITKQNIYQIISFVKHLIKSKQKF